MTIVRFPGTRAVLLLGFALAAVVSSSCRRREPYVKPPTPVKVSLVELEHGGRGLRYSADIRPWQQVELAFRVGGYVDSLLEVEATGGGLRSLQEGDRVTRGTVLARLRARDFEEKVKQGRAQLDQAVAAEEQARLELERASNLLGQKSLTRAEHEGVQAKRDAARARLEQARSVLAEAELAREDSELKAPWDAVILRRRIEAGALASPGTPAFSLADTRSMKVVFGAADTLLEQLRMGQEIPFTVEALRGESFPGKITRIAPWADPRTRVFEVELAAPNPQDRLKVGMIAQLRVPDAVRAKPAPVVPLAAIIRPPGEPGGYGVFVIEEQSGGTVARARSVRLGDVLGNRIVVEAGLAGGERVIVTGATHVLDGQEVGIIP